MKKHALNFTARFTDTNAPCSTMEVASNSFEACKKAAFNEVSKFHQDATITIFDKDNSVVGVWNYID